MKILLLALATIVFFFGLFLGVGTAKLCIQIATGEMPELSLLAAFPTAAFSFILIFIGIQFWRLKNERHARNVSGATGIIIWGLLSFLLIPTLQLDGIFDAVALLASILLGVLAYRLLMLGIHHSFRVANAIADNGGNVEIPPRAEGGTNFT